MLQVLNTDQKRKKLSSSITPPPPSRHSVLLLLMPTSRKLLVVLQNLMDNFRENDVQSDGIISRFFFHAAYPTLKLGSKRPLTADDLPELGRFESPCHNRLKIEKLWTEEVKSGRMNLGRALLAEYIRSMWKEQLLAFINFIARIGQAWALGMLMEEFGRHDGDASTSKKVVDARMAYIYAGLLTCCGLIVFPSKQHCFLQTYRKGLQLKVGLIATIYHKTLRLPSIGVDVSNGHVTNLASNDVERFQFTSVSAVFILVGPVASVLILIVGIFVTGPAFAIGFSLMILLMPIQIHVGRKFAQVRSRVAALTDSRVSLVSQTVHGNRVMKFNGWEDSFREKIAYQREQEVKVLYKASIYRAFNEALFYFTSLLVSVITFTIDVLANGRVLSPKTVFTAITLFNMLQNILSKHLPSAVMGLSECYISCRRIQAFLKLPEHEEVNATDSEQSSIASEVLSLLHVSCYWDRSSSEKESASIVALSDVSLSLQAGKLYCLIGIVGSGKSALLAALSGEMPVSEGKIERKYASLSYAVQDSWIMNATVRENIVMGSDFNQTWYDEVFQSCGLDDDFCHGDSQILGDRGVQCSGGQRARIGLARALYCDSDVLLLDDCLSAVDSKVARTLFYSAIQKLATKRGRCVVLATHQLQFCDEADCCIFMDKGRVVGMGLYSECVSLSDGKLLHTTQAGAIRSSSYKPYDNADREISALPSKLITDKAEAKEENVQKEKRTTGVIKMKTWIAYMRAVGAKTAFVLLALFAVTQALQLLVIVIVGNWSGAPADKQTSFINTVLWLTGGVVFLSITRAYLTFYSLIKASKQLHNLMLSSVLSAKIEFFDTNPVGRILNRFSADVGICDETLPLTIYDFSVGLFVVVGSIVTAVISLPFTLIALLPLMVYFIKLRRIFVKTTRELKRIDGIARSPIFAMMSESLKGVRTIRCNGKMDYFSKRFEDIQTAHTKAAFAFMLCSRWFAFNLDIISFVFTSVACFSAVLFHDKGWFDIQPSVLGLALTLLIQISTTNFPWIVRQSAVSSRSSNINSAQFVLGSHTFLYLCLQEVTNQMVSVERLHEFHKLPAEAPFELDHDKEICGNWPSSPSILVKDLTVRYRASLPVCLNGLSFAVGAGERLGIVGRTGSGKSSLVQALLRLLEAEKGFIEVDGVDISSIGLHRLRTSMAVIPQSPVLFSGYTVRDNLDPFTKYTDDTIWDALRSVQMIDVIEALPLQLNAAVAHEGSNFSVGQRQLLCLARALLLRNNIILLDEPSANVDSKTDQLLQKTLRERFSEATIISVAHRLDTIIDYDKVLVLGDGKMIEFGSPSDLLSKEGGQFLALVKSTGDEMAKTLFKRASAREATTESE